MLDQQQRNRCPICGLSKLNTANTKVCKCNIWKYEDSIYAVLREHLAIFNLHTCIRINVDTYRINNTITRNAKQLIPKHINKNQTACCFSAKFTFTSTNEKTYIGSPMCKIQIQLNIIRRNFLQSETRL